LSEAKTTQWQELTWYWEIGPKVCS